MEDEIKKLLSAAGELSRMIADHPVTLQYREYLDALGKDPRSRELLDRLVAMGKRLNEMLHSGREIRLDESAENERTKAELESNDLVKGFIASQKEYLILVQTVIEKIRNPDED